MSADLLESLIRGIAAETAREVASQVVREALERRPADAEWLTQAAAAKVAGVTPQTIRGWQGDGLLAKGRRGRVNAAELRAFLAANGKGAPETQTVDLSTERARRVAADILRKAGK